jgi:hypothetical protein
MKKLLGVLILLLPAVCNAQTKSDIFNPSAPLVFFGSDFSRKGANGNFEDGLNAKVSFKTELTICRLNGNNWEVLGTFARENLING